MVVRDPAVDVSMTAICSRELMLGAPVKLTEGAQVIGRGNPDFCTVLGTFSLRLSEIRAVGLGEFLASIEMLGKVLAAEGLFGPRLKRQLPFLPDTIGVISCRASHTENDVTTVAATRWPAVRSAIGNTDVRGPSAVAQIVEALRELDARPEGGVIVIARGGGSVEDPLPFSDETLCRAIAAYRTPVVSGVGHEPDNPLCDLVADPRAATPTDAAKSIVPDMNAELARVAELRHRAARAMRSWVGRKQHTLTALRSRPALADPIRMITERVTPVSELGYERCRDELIEVVKMLKQGGLDLDASLKLWERGEALARRCEEHPAGARGRIEAALAAAEGDSGS